MLSVLSQACASDYVLWHKHIDLTPGGIQELCRNVPSDHLVPRLPTFFSAAAEKSWEAWGGG